ncbi:MAG TPA: hypothetical protein PK843_05345 [bacterium]|nr:hypothetical protein [bacterium]HPN33915.1 hypothetical protein [bacterium]
MSKNFNTLIILALLGAVLYFGFGRYRHRILRFLPNSFTQQDNRLDPFMFMYDSDPKNDRFIKGSLRRDQFRLLDRVLNEEERNGGMRLSNGKVRQLAADDKEVIEAYDRWRRCCSLMRSVNYVIYPSQRSRRP